ncbi:DNA-binding response regulator [Deltaproteobacteria bacterium Smac51]|nr:DNA-binding response regulator [Deltaproteobacteria bacterium Smac51]
MLRVLLADDEPASNEIIRHYITRHSLPLEVIQETFSGDDTIEAIKSLRPDLVFLDIQMPVFNGLMVMEEISQSYQGEVAFIVVTAYAYFEYAQKAIQLGARDLLLKPVLYDQFCDSLMRVLGYRYTDNPQFNALLEYIHSNYAEDLTLQKCADRLATTPNNIIRMFKQQLDTSLVQYCNTVKIKKACDELKKGVPIKEASEKVGFNNLNYFYRTFKKIMNATPKEFLNSLRAGG